MESTVAAFKDPLRALPPGLHRRRFAARGVGFDAWIWRGGDGPVLLVNGATHGDEYEGPALLRAWAETWRPANLSGTVVAVPVLNEGAFFAGQRCHPADGGNLARAFPGRPRGSVTARLAHLFDTQLLAQCTHYIDLHSAGAAYELLPWTGYITHSDAAVDRTQREMAAEFAEFWCWAGPFLPGRTLSAAHDRGIPAIYVECRGAGGIAPADLENLDLGLRRVLHRLGLLDGRGPRPPRGKQPFRLTRDADEAHLQIHHPAPADGLFAPAVAVGERIRRGQIVGQVAELGSATVHRVRAERGGRVVMLRRQRSVRRGDALCTLAPV